MSHYTRAPLPRSLLGSWSWINKPPWAPPALGYEAAFLAPPTPRTRSPLIRQPLRQSHYGGSPSPLPISPSLSLSLFLFLPETASASSFGISPRVRSMEVTASCSVLCDSRGLRGWNPQRVKPTDEQSQFSYSLTRSGLLESTTITHIRIWLK